MQAFPRDERRLRVSASRSGDGRMTVAVRDAGVGIAAEHRDAVFEPFWTTRREGLGLGLAVCRSIVQAHRGTIAVESNPDRGVTFRVELPAAASEAGAAAQEIASPGASPRAASAVPTVCVVDEDAWVRESLVRQLAAEGWSALPYASASEFLERASLAEAGCVLLDIRMPGMSGIELLERLAGGGTAPPVVFLSGNGDVETGVYAMKLGAVDFLTKPVERDVLVAAVRKAFARHAGEQERARGRETSRALVARLSAREREVMEHVIRGRLNKQIAADLDIAEQTVKQHRGRVMEKLRVRSVPELLRVCETSGLFAAAAETGNRDRVSREARVPRR
jgi:FixJ family two-component response regulator